MVEIDHGNRLAGRDGMRFVKVERQQNDVVVRGQHVAAVGRTPDRRTLR